MSENENGRPACGNCRYYHELSKVCRRYPAHVIFLGIKQNIVQPKVGEPQFISAFPNMEKHGWCGEHAYKPETLQ
jgi:hypothetical protein